MGRLFGTDGVRGVANLELTAELAFRLGQAGAQVLTGEAKHRPKILVGKDTRISSDMLEAAICAGICSAGAQAVMAGVVPTPAIAYLTRALGADAGVVISASHNSMEYNGIKFFNKEGYKLSDETEDKIEAIIRGEGQPAPLPTGAALGSISFDGEAAERYRAFAAATIDVSLEGMTVAIDCANGAASHTSKSVLERAGAKVLSMHDRPDGININRGCGSTHMEDLQRFVKESGADAGLAFDGDADRVLAVDENGELVDGDQIMLICGLDMRSRGALARDTVVATVMSNLGFFLAAEKNGLSTAQTAVGDRYVLEEMVKEGYSLGGEQSGHIIFLEHNSTGDGLVTGLQLLAAMRRGGRSLSQLAGVMRPLPQVLVNAKVKTENKNAYKNDSEIMGEIEKIEAEFAGEGRVLIRPSGTEPLVRVMIEGKDSALIKSRAEGLARLMERKLN